MPKATNTTTKNNNADATMKETPLNFDPDLKFSTPINKTNKPINDVMSNGDVFTVLVK